MRSIAWRDLFSKFSKKIDVEIGATISVVSFLLLVVGKTLYPSIPKNVTQDDREEIFLLEE